MDNLSADSIRAKQSGMSYGQWKAINPNTKDQKVAIPKHEKVCRFCGKTFYTTRKQKAFCNEDCVDGMYEKRLLERQLERDKRRERMALEKG